MAAICFWVLPVAIFGLIVLAQAAKTGQVQGKLLVKAPKGVIAFLSWRDLFINLSANVRVCVPWSRISPSEC